jgi:hypothetical protein
MTCIISPGVIVCVRHEGGRLRVGNRYVFFDFHSYCGPSFFTDRAMTKPYEPADENDPVWPPFQAWLDKRNAAKKASAGEEKTA